MKNIKLGVAIMAHPSRRLLVRTLRQRLDAPADVVWDEKNDVWDTGRRALLAYSKNTTHHLVLQDDALPAKNLIATCQKLLKYVPPKNPVSLYMGRSRTIPRRFPMSPLVELAKRQRASFAVFDGPWWGPGIIVPTYLINDLVQFGDERTEITQYDHKINHFFVERGSPCYYTTPSLVDHITENTPSLLGHGNSRGRSTPWFAGTSSQVYLRPWSSKIVTPGLLPRKMRQLFPSSPSYPRISTISEPSMATQLVSRTIRIPKIIHHIWVGSPVPEQFIDYIESWKKFHPDWEHKFWDDKSLKNLKIVNQHLINNATTLIPGWGIGQFTSDVIRLELLNRFGGMYVDTDFEALKPIDDLITDTNLFAAWELQDHWLANGLIGSTPGHPFIKELIKRLPGSVNRRRGQRPAIVSGPRFLTRTYRTLRPQMTCIPQTAVFPYSWSDLGTAKANPPWPADAYAVHHWNNQRQARELGEKR